MPPEVSPVTDQARVSIDGDHKAPLLQILALLFLTFCVLSVTAMLTTKRILRNRFDLADGILFIALLLAAAQLSTLLSPDSRVIGDSTSNLSIEQEEAALKALYSGAILYVLTLGATKIALLVALLTITPVTWHRVMIYGTGVIVVAWVFTAVFSVSFQCPPPLRWDVLNKGCIDIRSLGTYVASLSIFTDLLLIIIPTMIIQPVQLSWRKRWTLMSGFWFRTSVIGATVAQIIYIQRLNFDARFVETVWKAVVCGEAVLTASIVATCVPFLKPFLMSLESGFLRVDDETRRHGNTTAGLPEPRASLWASKYIRIGNQSSRARSVEMNTQQKSQETSS